MIQVQHNTASAQSRTQDLEAKQVHHSCVQRSSIICALSSTCVVDVLVLKVMQHLPHHISRHNPQHLLQPSASTGTTMLAAPAATSPCCGTAAVACCNRVETVQGRLLRLLLLPWPRCLRMPPLQGEADSITRLATTDLPLLPCRCQCLHNSCSRKPSCPALLLQDPVSQGCQRGVQGLQVAGCILPVLRPLSSLSADFVIEQAVCRQQHTRCFPLLACLAWSLTLFDLSMC